MSKKELAAHYFQQGYNCAQSVLLAFHEEAGLSMEQAAKLASSFGGGMGKLREVCGAVSAAFMVLGLMEGYSDPNQPDAKAELYQKVQNLGNAFRSNNGSLICRDLLEEVPTTGGFIPEARTQSYYQQRPCNALVENAAELLESHLNARLQS